MTADRLQDTLADYSAFHYRMNGNALLSGLLFDPVQFFPSSLVRFQESRRTVWKGVSKWIDDMHQDERRLICACD